MIFVKYIFYFLIYNNIENFLFLTLKSCFHYSKRRHPKSKSNIFCWYGMAWCTLKVEVPVNPGIGSNIHLNRTILRFCLLQFCQKSPLFKVSLSKDGLAFWNVTILCKVKVWYMAIYVSLWPWISQHWYLEVKKCPI